MIGNKILKDKRLWIVTIILFFLLLVFFDRNSIIDRHNLKQDIKELETQRDYFLNKIAEDSTVLERLKDNDYLEQYAREHYLMKRDSDVVFVIPDKR